MIDLKSNLDRLEDSASTFYKRGGNDGASTSLSSGDALQTASDLRGAVQDISNLRDSNAILERNIKEMSAEINTLKTAPVDLGSVINEAINGHCRLLNDQLATMETRLKTVEEFKVTNRQLDSRIDDQLEQFKEGMTTDDIAGLEQMIDDHITQAACDNDRDDETRDTVRDMIRDGEIIVTVDVS